MNQVARQGLVRTFQHSTLFAEMSLLENAVIGTHRAFRPSLLAAMLGADRRQRAEAERRAMEALAFFDLDDLAEQRAGDLAHGHQRALGMAIAYAAQPDVMLLDEPFTGMNAEETGRMMAVTEKLRADGMTIVIVEHDMKAIMGLCDRITCMSFGKLLAEGGPDDIRSDPAVIQAYLGGASNAA
jgi:ABC-type branched-subunit amino acid transport system ATPase component